MLDNYFSFYKGKKFFNILMKKVLIIFIFLVSANAQEFKKNATSGFIFLQIPVTAKTASMGEASIALSELNSAGVFSNPASLGFSDQSHSFSASYSPWIADIKHYASSYLFNSNVGSFVVSLIAVDFGSMPRTQKVTGQKFYEVNGTFNASALAFGLSYSKKLTDRFSFGITTKFIKETIDIYSAKNFAFDGGILYYTGLSSLRIAAVFQNFGVDTKYLNDPFKMPSTLRLGIASEIFGDYNSDYKLTACIEALHPNNSDEKINLGFEFSWIKMLSFRSGYKFFYDEENYSLGIGFKPNYTIPFEVDFAFSNFGRLGKVLRFSIQFNLI